MDPLRLNRKDGLFILICLLVLTAGLFISLKYFRQAFPEASIEFRYNRAQTESMALVFLQDGMALTPASDYRHAGRFGYDGLAKIYLEKELGVEGARRYLGSPVRLWYWQHRWFKPSTKEEFRVYVTPAGEIVRAQHEIEEKAAGANLPEDSARVLAERFLFGSMKMDPAKFTFLEAEKAGRPNRTDWVFTWKAAGIEPVKGSDYRYQVGLTGDKIGSYREFLHVPEAWQASFGKLRSYNRMAGSFSGVGMILTVVGMVALFFLRIRKREIRWKTALWFGIVATALMLLNQINEFPLELYGYETTASWSGFLLETILLAIFSSFGAGIAIFGLTAATETIYRERYGHQMAIPRMFTAQALRTKSAFKNILLGVTLTAFFFAYQIVFYLTANRFGAWSPSDVPYDNLLNTAMPWLAVLFIGFFPAVTEEFMSRAFSIPFLQMLFRNKATWLAVLIPAFIWGFGHAEYPNEPFYIRGLEVGLAGIIIGIIMLKFGILAPLIWHYTVDALYTALLLFRSDNPYFIITAAVATGLLVVPLLVALIAYLRKGQFAPETGLLNRDVTAPAEETTIVEAVAESTTEPTTVLYKALPGRSRLIASGLLAIGILAALIPCEKIGKFMTYRLPKETAIKIFSDSLRATGWANPDTLRMAAFINEDDSELEDDDPMIYLLKHAGSVEQFNDIADDRLGLGRWRVLAWVPENRLRFMGSVHAKTGQIERMFPLLPEEMPGDSLPKDSARVLVEARLLALGEDLSKLDLKDAQQNTQPKRVDHSFTWEARDGDPRNVAEAKYRRSGGVDGNYLSFGRRPWYKAPESWQRERKATTTLCAIKDGLTYLAIGGVIAWSVLILVLRTRKGFVMWKKAFLIAIIPGAVALAAGFNRFHLGLSDYFFNIEIPWGVFQTTLVTAWIITGITLYLMFTVALATLSALYPDALNLFRRKERRAAANDVWVAAAGWIGSTLIGWSAVKWLEAWRPEWIIFTGWNVPSWLAVPVPLLNMLQFILREQLLDVFLLAFFAYLWMGPMKKTGWRIALLVGILILLLPRSAVEPGEWLLSMLGNVVLVATAYIFMRFVVAGRPVLLFGAAVVVGIFIVIVKAVGAGYQPVIIHACLAAVIMLIALVWWLYGRKKSAA
ncbi:CPBP family intramembrane metalloprotease [candidate division KSB1 bacterium]|nr:MAG: CPBP family intramembrane metalloprotease [candidate division KSB1 bacterium]